MITLHKSAVYPFNSKKSANDLIIFQPIFYINFKFYYNF